MDIEIGSSSRAPDDAVDGRGHNQVAQSLDRGKGKGARTREKILFMAGRHFARHGYSAVRLKDIAGEVGVTPAMVVRYFGSKRALFDAVARVEPRISVAGGMSTDELAMAMIRYWQDPDLRTPAMALIRSLEVEGGALFRATLRRQVIDPWSIVIRGEDADVRLRLAVALGLGFGLFGLGSLLDPELGNLLDPDQPPLQDDEIKRFVPYLARLLAVCLDPDPLAAEGGH